MATGTYITRQYNGKPVKLYEPATKEVTLTIDAGNGNKQTFVLRAHQHSKGSDGYSIAGQRATFTIDGETYGVPSLTRDGSANEFTQNNPGINPKQMTEDWKQLEADARKAMKKNAANLGVAVSDTTPTGATSDADARINALESKLDLLINALTQSPKA